MSLLGLYTQHTVFQLQICRWRHATGDLTNHFSSMKRFLAAVLIVAFGACKKDYSISEPEGLPSPRDEVLYEEPIDSLPDPSIKINSLDLDGIAFTPSISPIACSG